MRFLALAIGLAAGNFVYPAIGADVPNYMVAFERTCFQVIALFIGWLAYADTKL